MCSLYLFGVSLLHTINFFLSTGWWYWFHVSVSSWLQVLVLHHQIFLLYTFLTLLYLDFDICVTSLSWTKHIRSEYFSFFTKWILPFHDKVFSIVLVFPTKIYAHAAIKFINGYMLDFGFLNTIDINVVPNYVSHQFFLLIVFCDYPDIKTSDLDSSLFPDDIFFYIYWQLKVVDSRHICGLRSLCFITRANLNPAGNYMFKVNNRNTRTRCEICSKLTIKTPNNTKWGRKTSLKPLFVFEKALHEVKANGQRLSFLDLDMKKTVWNLCSTLTFWKKV